MQELISGAPHNYQGKAAPMDSKVISASTPAVEGGVSEYTEVLIGGRVLRKYKVVEACPPLPTDANGNATEGSFDSQVAYLSVTEKAKWLLSSSLQSLTGSNRKNAAV